MNIQFLISLVALALQAKSVKNSTEALEIRRKQLDLSSNNEESP